MDEMRQRGGSMKGITRVADRENEYQSRHRQYLLSPEVGVEHILLLYSEVIHSKKEMKVDLTKRL